jgi:hypothetical protein
MGEKQLASLPAAMTVEPPGDDWKTFADTAAIMKCLDLVITTDTVIANLAGALGVPTWVAIQYVPDWKWMFDARTAPGTRPCVCSVRKWMEIGKACLKT